MASPALHTGLVKWFNVKAGYGFIQKLNTGTDVFCHVSGLTRPLKNQPPREGDQVLLAVREGAKGPEACDVAPTKNTSAPPKTQTPRKRRIYRLKYTPALAGGNNHRLQEILPLILQHNGLPAINIPSSALTANTRTKLPRRGHPGTKGKSKTSPVAGSTTPDQPAAAAEAKVIYRPNEDIRNNLVGNVDQENSTTPDQPAAAAEARVVYRPNEDIRNNLVGKIDQESEDEEGNDEEDEEVDILGSGSEREADSPPPSTPNRRSTPQPPSYEREEDQGWVTKEKRRRPPASQLALPKGKQTNTPSAEPRQSPIITRLRKERRDGIVHDLVLNTYKSHQHPKDDVTSTKKKSNAAVSTRQPLYHPK
ncbi:Cold shock-like protein CspB [Portunus trituberculatus]|uniref:Cold shock-like protein CspB n=1 Tax=Portunus trituberculatus TaxID=210409 RepID=A0A5B7JB04_PORTR|nr:Cold shock-like protein CspB [Portunus trituberculatus]